MSEKKFMSGYVDVLKLINSISEYERISFSSLIYHAQQIHDTEKIEDELRRDKEAKEAREAKS